MFAKRFKNISNEKVHNMKHTHTHTEREIDTYHNVNNIIIDLLQDSTVSLSDSDVVL